MGLPGGLQDNRRFISFRHKNLDAFALQEEELQYKVSLPGHAESFSDH